MNPSRSKALAPASQTASPGLIKVIPERLDVLNYARGGANEPLTWRVPPVDFEKR